MHIPVFQIVRSRTLILAGVLCTVVGLAAGYFGHRAISKPLTIELVCSKPDPIT